MVNRIQTLMQNNNIPLENDYVDVIIKARNGALHIPNLAKVYWMSVLQEATTGLYFDKIGTDKVFVFETPTIMEVEERKEINLMLLKYIVGL